MIKHIKIDGISLCCYNIPLDIKILALNEHIPFSCHILDDKHEMELTDFLFSCGYNVEVINGPCDQRDDYCGELE